MSVRLVLVRHGESVDNVAGRLSGWTDSALTPRGMEQAWRMAEYVAGSFRLSALYASPLTRAVETAQPLAGRTGLRITFDEDLRELHFGNAEGLTVPELLERFPSEWQRAQNEDDAEFGFPGGETRARFYSRLRRVFAELIRRHDGQTIAVVSHGGVLSTLLADVAEGMPQRWRRFPMDNCSISELQARDGHLTIIRSNVTDHLTIEAVQRQS